MTQGVKTGLSSQTEVEAALIELRQQLDQDNIALVILFFSTHFSAEALVQALPQYFTGIAVVGCSTAGEIGVSGYVQESISGLSFSSAHFDISTALYPNLGALHLSEWHEQTLKLHQHHNHQYQLSDDRNSFGLLLVDGLSRREEPLTQVLANSLQGLPLVGGSAGDDLKYERCFMLYEGKMHHDSAILVLITTDLSFSLLHAHHIHASTQRMVVTEAIPEQRIISEINGYPAAIEYARQLGVSDVNDLTPDFLAAHPAVVVIGKAEYVRSIQRINPDYSLSFYCAIDTGIVIRAGEGTDLALSLKRSFAEIAREYRTVSAVIAFDCILRRVELQQKQQLELASEVFAQYPCVGFSTYGEQVSSLHVNQTFTGVVIGQRHE